MFAVIPALAGLWTWLVSLVTGAVGALATFLLGKMAYEKAITITITVGFIITCAALVTAFSLSVKALIIGARVVMPGSLGMATYFLPNNVNVIFGIIATARIGRAALRWTIATMSAHVPGNPRHGLLL